MLHVRYVDNADAHQPRTLDEEGAGACQQQDVRD
jgi:hypothetical protein